MIVVLVLVLLVAPAIELLVALQVAHAIGYGPTVALVLVALVAGALVMRHAGSSWWGRMRAAARAGRAPEGQDVLERALLFLAGLLLLLPGFITDVLGLLLLVPPLRRALAALATRRFTARFVSVTAPGGIPLWQRQSGRDDVIKGEVVREDAPGDPPAIPPT